MQESKVMPQAIDFEEMILGCIIHSPESYSKVSEILNEDVFYKNENKIIYRYLTAMEDNGQPIETITLVDALRSGGELKKVGGAYAISKLSLDILSVKNLEAYATILFKYYAKRRIIAICDTFKAKAYDDTTEPSIMAEELTNDVFEVISGIGDSHQLIGLSKVVSDFAEQVKEEQDNGVVLSGLDSGSKGINELTGGLNAGDLFILAARPGMGKSVRAWKLLQDAAQSGIFFSLEMSAKQLAARIVAGKCGITLSELKKRNIPNHVWAEVNKLLAELDGSKISIQTMHSVTLSKIKSDCKAHILKHGSLDMIVVDYIQIMGVSKQGNREQEISVLSRGLKNIAKEFNVPLIALAQLSRAVEQRPDKRPILSDLRESGSIEQDADVVGFLYRPAYYSDFSDGCMGEYSIPESAENWEGISELVIRKNRQGDQGIVIEKFIGAHATYRDFEKQSFEINPQDLKESEPF